MAERALTRADAALLVDIPASMGVTARKLERWRQAGLMPETLVLSPGSVETAYPEGTAAQVAELVGILKQDRRLDRALLRLFMRDRWVSEDRLKARYLRFYGKIVALAGLVSPESVAEDGEKGDALDVVEDLVAREGSPFLARDGLVRTMRSRLRKFATDSLPVEVLVRGAVTQFLTGFFGGRLWVDHDAVEELKAALGIARAETDDFLGRGPLLPRLSDEQVTEMCTAFPLTDVLATVRGSSLADLRMARDVWVHRVRLLANLETYAACMQGRRDVGGLGMLPKIAHDELMLALFVPCAMVVQKALDGWHVELDPVWEPDTTEGREFGEAYALMGRFVGSLDRAGKNLLRRGEVGDACAHASEEVRRALYEWGARRDDRKLLV